MHDEHSTTVAPTRVWPRAAGLLGVALALSVLRPAVLIAVPTLMLLAARRRYSGAVVVMTALGLAIVLAGPRESFWYVERAWALVLGGWFVAVTLLTPRWTLSSRSLAAVFGSVGVTALYFALDSGAWAALDWTVGDSVTAAVTTTLDGLTLLREGQPVSPAFVAAMYEMASAQAAVFPALVAIGSMASLGVAWWIVVRVTEGVDAGLGPLRDFRFNDHLVWLVVGGLVLVVTRWSEALGRIGANLLVFMGALYALRGAGVVLFVTGGLSVLAYALLVLGLVIAAPSIVGVAILIGIGDTWLDLRARAASTA